MNKTLLDNDGCKYAVTNPDQTDKGWAHLRLGSGPGMRSKTGARIGGGAYPHLFCGEPQQAGSPYCAAHHKLCYRGPGKDARSLEEMIYSIDQSQFRGRVGYADHTEPMDVELRKDVA